MVLQALGDIAHANEDVATKILELKHTREDKNEAIFDAKALLEQHFQTIKVLTLTRRRMVWTKTTNALVDFGMPLKAKHSDLSSFLFQISPTSG